MSDDSARLAGVIRLSMHGRGPRLGFVFDPHRLAFPAWAAALGAGPAALLVTLDRHFDLVAPKDPCRIPNRADVPLRVLDEYARWELDERNYDHILAAMHAGLVRHAVFIARASPRGAHEGPTFTDRDGFTHSLVRAPNVDQLAYGFGTHEESHETRTVRELIEAADRIILDVDLDCFTTMSDADPSAVIPWPRDVIRDFLLPEGSRPFWNALLAKTIALTVAREPSHAGGLIASGRLFEEAAAVLFRELLQTDTP